MNKNKRKLVIIILGVTFSFLLLINFIPVQAKDTIFVPQVGIPEQKVHGISIEPGAEIPVKGTTFAYYMIAIYEWSIRAIVILAIIMIMFAGFSWMTAGGSATAIGKAKTQITSAFIGLILAIGAYTLLNLINPSLVRFRDLDKYVVPVKGFENEVRKCKENEVCVYVIGEALKDCECKSSIRAHATWALMNHNKRTFHVRKDEKCGEATGPDPWTIGGKCFLGDCLISESIYTYENPLVANFFIHKASYAQTKCLDLQGFYGELTCDSFSQGDCTGDITAILLGCVWEDNKCVVGSGSLNLDEIADHPLTQCIDADTEEECDGVSTTVCEWVSGNCQTKDICPLSQDELEPAAPHVICCWNMSTGEYRYASGMTEDCYSICGSGWSLAPATTGDPGGLYNCAHLF